MNVILRTALSHLFHKGTFVVTDSSGNQVGFGDGTGKPLHIRINSAAAERAIALDPSLRFAEAYMESDIDILEGDIYEVLKLVFENAGATATKEPWMLAIEGIRRATRRFYQMNNLRRSSENVKRHYDLSGELYKLFLDPDMQYSCAYVETPDTTLEEAQLAKKRHIAAKLGVKQGQKVLDIGCGWGGLGLYLGLPAAIVIAAFGLTIVFRQVTTPYAPVAMPTANAVTQAMNTFSRLLPISG